MGSIACLVVVLCCRQVLDAEDYPDSPDPEALLDLMLEVECEMPNSNLHNFRGRASIKQAPGDPGKILPITMNQMLLRGCMLKNSHSVLGLVVYTGKDTRIQMNSAAAPLKIGSFDHFLNMQASFWQFVGLNCMRRCGIVGTYSGCSF